MNSQQGPYPTAIGRPWREHAWLVLATVIWFAMVTGILEATALLTRWAVFNRFTWTSVHVIWMAPLANALLLLPPAILLAALARYRPRWVSLPVLAGILALGAVICLLMVTLNGSLAIWAVVILAGGVAFQTGSVIARRRQGFEGLIRRSTPVVVGLVLGMAVILPGWMMLRERLAVRSLQGTGPRRPNVLLIILDTVRSASVSLYQHSVVTTPRLERWSRRGIVFDMAMAPAPWTLPSHGAMFTGRWPHELTAGWNTPLRNQFPTLAETLRNQGYVTAGFVANYYYTTRESGLHRGFIHYEDRPLTASETLRSSLLGQVMFGLVLRHRYTYQPERTTHRKSAEEVSQSLLDWLSGSNDRPWFAFVNFFDAHKPYHVPATIRAILPSGTRPVDDYARSIRYLDTELGKLLNELERRGLLANTLVIITSDHGEQFGSHQVVGHGNSLYGTVTRVPLIIRFPGRVPEGVRVIQPVSLRDLARTILDLTGVADTNMPGTSLSKTWGTQSGPIADTVLSELMDAIPNVSMRMKTPMFALMTRENHYIRQANGEEEVYDMIQDPLERVNLADSATGRRILPRFRAKLKEMLPVGMQ